ncbi:MAG TPA: chromosome segregation protein SMC, partial [Rhodocyclaceae bacterium]|nr:chromosome segregation protein SMC [Rhodocyclaceae bacterium]
MRLSKLKLAGFKSFVDPTTLLTPGQLVGVVGPNGCGKSNVIDAVRWVLGESRASALRGESMQDVIFNGSTARKPVSRASVELIFDNADGRAGGQWSQYVEISVKRIVDRSGDSEYLINNVRVRRKDVIDLFLGTGLGPRAYAIIEQGMISRVIEARPEEVRAFLEEAAGITKYKERRRETEGRLSDARDNLARIEDIRAELSHQIEKLGAQAEVAQHYKTLNETLVARQLLLWVFKREQANAEQEKAAEGIAQSSAELERNTERLRTLEAQVAAARETHACLSEAVGVAQGDLYAISSEVSRVENELKTLRETRVRLTQHIEQIGLNETQWRERARQLVQERERWQALKDAGAQRLQEAQYQYESAQQKLPDVDSAHRAAQKRLDDLRREHALAEQQTRVEEARCQSSLRALEALALRRQRVEQERSQVTPHETPDLDRIEATAANLSILFNTTQNDTDIRATALEQAKATLTAAQDAEAGVTRQVTAKHARLEALRTLQMKLRDQGDMGDWLRATGLGELVPLWQSLHVDAGWELAVEAVLRERIAALGPLVGNMPNDLFANPAPVTVVVIRGQDKISPPAIAFDGAPLLSKLRCGDARLRQTLEAWLSNVYAVDGLNRWLDDNVLVPEGIRLVSQAGAVLTARELTLFAPDARTHGVVERQREIEVLAKELMGLEAEQGQRRQAVHIAETALQTAQEALIQSRREQDTLQQQLHSAQLEVVRVQQARARFDERVAQLARELEDVANAEATERTHLREAEQGRDKYRADVEQFHAQLDAARQALGECEQTLNQHREKMQALSRGHQEAAFSARECASKLDDIARNETLTREQISHGEAELARLIAERDGLDETTLQTALKTALDIRNTRELALTT